MSTSSHALQVMVRNPVVGLVKTRLIPALGAAGAHAVYCRLLNRVLDIAAKAEVERVTVWVDAEPLDDSLRSALDERGLAHAFQHHGDLGQRMRQALRHGLQHSQQVVLIGSDCPDYSTAYLTSAFTLLQRHDVVLGPAADGGYVMIGARHRCPPVFDNMPWSTPDLLAATRAQLRLLDLSFAETAPLRDIDTAADLAGFPVYRDAAQRMV